MGYAELCAALDERLDELLSPARAAHSRRVAELTASICLREGLDPEKGRAAGLAHDLCKEMPKKAQRELAAAYAEAEAVGGGVVEAPMHAAQASSLMADKIVHGPAAAALLARDYGVGDEELLEAIAIHTVGRPGMRGLSIALYCADKLEPGRERLDEEETRRCLGLGLEDMLLSVVEGVVGWMRSQGRAVAPETMILYSTLQLKAGKS
jgi:predicted HD superfamily hydrolase involved in NAD metabolism